MSTTQPKRDIVMYLGPGAMSGIFSVGVMQAVAESSMADRICAMYGVSAGSVTGMYFLSGQLEQAGRLYTEDMSGEKYIRWRQLSAYFLQILSNRVLRTHVPTTPLFQSSVVETAVTGTRQVDMTAYNQSAIDMKYISYRLDTGTHEYLEIQSAADIVPVIKATTSGQPGHPESITIAGHEYIDGATIADQQYLERIKAEHPDKKIVLVLSSTVLQGSRVRRFLMACGVAVLTWILFGFAHAKRVIAQEFTLVPVQTDDTVTVIQNEMNGHRFATDPTVLQEILEHGRVKGKQWLAAVGD